VAKHQWKAFVHGYFCFSVVDRPHAYN
jgi:hypothetical protein